MTAARVNAVLLFANPTSGRGLGGRFAERAARLLRAEGRVATVVTDRARLAEELAARLTVGEPAATEIWVFGGDGTLAELVQRLPAGPPALLSLFPTGTGNVVARTLDIPRSFGGALAIARHGTPRPVDVGHVGDRCFTFMVSAGLDAEIAAEVARRRRGPMRRSDWVRAALRAPSYAREAPLRVVADGRDLGRVAFAAAFNCGLYAGSFRVCPAARCDDGLLHLLLLREPIRPRWLRVAFAAWRGRPHELPDATLVAAREIRFEGAAATQVDGDPGPSGDLELTIAPAAVRVRAPG